MIRLHDKSIKLHYHILFTTVSNHLDRDEFGPKRFYLGQVPT